MIYKIIIILLICSSLVKTQSFSDEIPTHSVDEGTYIWNGYGLDNTTLNITSENFTITVTIEECNIGQSTNQNDNEANSQYLTLTTGNDEGNSSDGRIFAYITKPKKIFFYSNSIILELKTPTKLDKICELVFEKAEPVPTTLPPLTTTEIIPTLNPDTSKYSTVFISGKSINEFDEKLMETLKNQIVDMAENYTETEGFCLKHEKKIEPDDLEIIIMEECPPKWPNSENCIKLTYGISITSKINESCTLWPGYQITQSHLDLMWNRLADDFIKIDFTTYGEPSLDSTLTWWIICIILITLVFVASMITLNIIWKRKEIRKIASVHQNEDVMPDFVKKISNMSLTPPYFQSIPPMFDKTYRSNATLHHDDEKEGTENEGFHYDEILSYEDDNN